MTWVKICGTTNLEDALVAVDAGADAVGFVFYEKSPRCVSVETAREIVQQLPESVEKVGVFVGQESDPGSTLLNARLTGTQIYLSAEGTAGSRGPTTAIGAGLLPRNPRFIMAFSMGHFNNDVNDILHMTARIAELKKKAPEGFSFAEGIFDTLLLDSGNSRQPGGTGQTFDWIKSRGLSSAMRDHGFKLIVAGGLSPDNVGEAIETLQPWGVDVASGVEASPGKKDPEKVRAFVKAVREFDRKVG